MRPCAGLRSKGTLSAVLAARARLPATARGQRTQLWLRRAPQSSSLHDTADCGLAGSAQRRPWLLCRPSGTAHNCWRLSGMQHNLWQPGCIRCAAISQSESEPERLQAAAVTRDAAGLADSRRQRRADSERDNRIAVALLAAGLAVAAAGRWTEVVRIARDFLKPTDAVAAVLLLAAAWRMKLREQMKEGVDQLSALLDSVMLLGQLAQDIAVVKADIKQVRDFLRGVYERAAWLPGKVDAELTKLYASRK